MQWIVKKHNFSWTPCMFFFLPIVMWTNWMEYHYLQGRPVTLGAMYDERSVTSFPSSDLIVPPKILTANTILRPPRIIIFFLLIILFSKFSFFPNRPRYNYLLTLSRGLQGRTGNFSVIQFLKGFQVQKPREKVVFPKISVLHK